jgi:hypothetical protein
MFKHPYREAGIPTPEKYPKKKRPIHKYVSAHDANILEEMYKSLKPSDGYEAYIKVFLSLESDFARMLFWHLTPKFHEDMSWWLMKEEE